MKPDAHGHFIDYEYDMLYCYGGQYPTMIEFDFATISTSFLNCKVASHCPLMISDIINNLFINKIMSEN